MKQKTRNFKLLSVSLILMVFLSGCFAFPSLKADEPLKIESNALLAGGYQFDKVKFNRFLESSDLYSISDESELALLVMKHFESGIYKTKYVSDTNISYERVISFLEMLVPENFSLKAGVIKYNSIFDKQIEDTYFIELVLDKDQHEKNEAQARAIIESLNIYHESPAKQVRAIHDYLVVVTAYDESIKDFDVSEYRNHPSFSPQGIYDHQVAVCSGYARAFMQLTRILDIPSVMVTSLNMNHAWNMVYVDDEWRFVDVTWDDPVPNVDNRILHTYYMLNLKDFKNMGNHYFDLPSNSSLGVEEVFAFSNYAFALD